MEKKEILVSKSVLSSVLFRGGMFAGKNKAFAAAMNVRIASHGGRIRVESTDTTSSIRAYDVCEDGVDVCFCVDYKKLLSYVQNLRDGMVSLVYNEEKKKVTVSHSNGKINLPAYDKSEFVDFPVKDKKPLFSVSGEVFASLVGKASSFTIGEQNQFSPLSSVCVTRTGNDVRIVGASHSLICMSIFGEKCEILTDEDFSFLLSKKDSLIIAKTFATADTVTVELSDNAVYIKTDDALVYSRLSEGKYPRLGNLPVAEYGSSYSVARGDFQQSMKRIMAQSDKKDCAWVNMQTSDGELTLKYEALMASTEMQEIVPCKCHSSELSCKIDVESLCSVLSCLGSDEVVFDKGEVANHPMRFREQYDGVSEFYFIAPTV